MNEIKSRDKQTPQEILREVMALCADCDTCRTMLEEECVFFPELYRLWDQEKEEGIPISDEQLRRLVDLCTFCGLCPCPRIPADVMEAKSRYVGQEGGLPASVKLLIDVPRMAKICGTFPKLYNALRVNPLVATVLRKMTAMHPDRELPGLPEENFFQWAQKRGLGTRKEGGRTLAYFAGCTAGYLFPQVGRSTVQVLERNGMSVYVPKQECCGMPFLLEGDLVSMRERAQANLDHLRPCLERGDQLVGSCSTCSFFMKSLIKERAYYSEAYQRSVGAGPDEVKVPHFVQGKKTFRVLKKAMFRHGMKDDGYFSPLDPMARVAVSENFFDAGEFLAGLHGEGKLDTHFSAVPERMVYFAPCHQREQKINRPYLDLLRLIPGLKIEPAGGVDCCGMGGNFGYKESFHENSLSIGAPLAAKITKQNPQAIVTDCLSCKLQFGHTLPSYPVYHPMEVLARAYGCGS